jgi:steroid delta-isomerase
MASREAIQAAVAAHFGATRAIDASGFAATFAPDGVTHGPARTPPYEGREAIRQLLQGFIDGCAQVGLTFAGLTEDRVFIAGNSAALKWTGQLTPKEGRALSFEGIDVLEVNGDDQVQTARAYWDPAPVLAALQG